MYYSAEIAVDHITDHLPFRSTRKQWTGERRRARFSERKGAEKAIFSGNCRHRSVWEQDAAGSNPVTPTIKERRPSRAPLFYLRRDGRFEAAEKRSFSKRRRRGRSRILSLRPKRPNAERILRFRSFHAISGALPPLFVSRDLMIKFNP